MEKFKAFLKGKKVDKHFKRSGAGARLTDGPSDSNSSPSVILGSSQGGSGGIDRVAASDIAAQAALKRLYAKEDPNKVSASQKKIQMIAQRELEEERRRAEAAGKTPQEIEEEMKQLGLSPAQRADEREIEHSDVIKGVFYTCDLLGDDVALTKKELQAVIEEFLLEQMKGNSEERVISTVLMLYSLNKKEQRNIAVETIGRYIQNIAENQEEPKFRRIRLSNKAFQERVASVKGGREFLEAVGFEEKMEPFKDGEPQEPFLVISPRQATDVGHLISALESLRSGESVPLRVSRDTKAFIIDEGARVPLPKLPDDFFDLSAAELKKEQEARRNEVDKILSLRTREMRERDEVLRKYKYKYTLLRIRFPDRFVIQGTFGCYENLQAVRTWVCSHIAHQATAFNLRDAVSGAVLERDALTLSELGMAPAAVIHLDWAEPVAGPSVDEDLLREAVPLHI